MNTDRLLNTAAFVLAAAAAFATFGGSALLARQTFQAAERIASAPAPEVQHVVVIGHRSRKA